jgi:hypothetical protein
MEHLSTGPFVMILALFTLGTGIAFAFWQILRVRRRRRIEEARGNATPGTGPWSLR